MSKRLLEFDHFSGIATYHEYDAETDLTTLSYQGGDLTPNLEATLSLRNDEEYSKKGIKDEMWHYAHIPDSVLLLWHSQGVNIHDSKALLAKVNEPEYAKFRVTTKKHGKALYKHFI